MKKQRSTGRITLASNPVTAYLKRNGGVLAAILVMCVIMTILSPYFLTTGNLLQVMKQTAATCIVTFAMCIVLISGEIDLSVASVVALSGCVTVALINAGIPTIAAMLAGVLVGGVVGLADGLIISRTGMPSFIVTLGMQSIARGCAYFSTGGLSIPTSDPILAFVGNGKILGIPFLIWMVALCMLFCWVLMNKTVFGRGVYARGSNREAARYAGINIKNICLKTYVIGGILTGIAGVMMAGRLASGQPTVATGLEGDCIAAAVLGGTAFTGGNGTIGGAFLGVLVIGMVNNGMNLLELPSFWQMVVKGIVIIAAVYIDTVKKMRESRV